MLKLENKWIWDFWLTQHESVWHIFFLQADKALIDPELRHWNVSIGHATSENLREWNYLGTCFQPAISPAWDDKTTWTGSVVQDEAGLWHLFYTGTSEQDKGKKQRLGHATSTDLHHWQRVDTGLCLDIDTRWYEDYTPNHWHDRAMRDPWVIRDPNGDGWLMFFTARVPNIAEPNAGGAIGLARSSDLQKWSIQPPIWQGGFGQMEVPQVLSLNGRWYCLFCTADEHWSADYSANAPTPPLTGTHYLMAENIEGPWRLAPGAFLDGSVPNKRYSGKIIPTDNGLKFMGFCNTDAQGQFVGEVCDPVEITVDEKGLLHLHVE